jgi:hypothetical protein
MESLTSLSAGVREQSADKQRTMFARPLVFLVGVDGRTAIRRAVFGISRPRTIASIATKRGNLDS